MLAHLFASQNQIIMPFLPVLLALSPVLFILVLLIIRRAPADVAGLAGWAAAVLVAVLFFQTPISVAMRASLAGLVASLPIALVVGTSIWQMTVMMETGAIARVVALIKTIAPGQQIVQIMLINIGVGTLLTALGAVPVSILPPIMMALGYSPFISIALPALGYDALCTYALLGVPVVVFSNFVNLPVNEVGGYFARFMPVISACIALAMLWIVGGWRMVWRGLVPALLTGLTAGFVAVGMNAIGLIPLTGIAAGLAVMLAMLLYLALTGRKLLDRGALTEADITAEKRMPIWVAISPWLFLVGFSLLVNLPALPLYELFFHRLAMPVEIITGAPERMRIFWQAYFWILVSTLLAFPILRAKREQVALSTRKWLKRAPRPVFAAAIFFSMAYVINHSGKALDFSLPDPSLNMVQVIAASSAAAFGTFYPIIASFLGLMGGFISGSEASSIAMLTELHLSTAEKIGAAGLLIAAASGIGGGLASVISPAKLQNAAASIDRIGEETSVIRVTLVISVVITAVVAVMAMFWAF
jgi:lactate permease